MRRTVICSTLYEQRDWESTRVCSRQSKVMGRTERPSPSREVGAYNKSTSVMVNGDDRHHPCVNIRRTGMDGRD